MSADCSSQRKVFVCYPKIVVQVGAEKTFEALHISDTHLLFADGRDNPDKYRIAMRRYGEYEYTNVGRNVPYFLDALIYAKEHDLIMLHTGDLIDFVSEQNLEVAQKLFDLSGIDYLMCAGNHEYTHYSGQHPETEEEKKQGRQLVPVYFRNNLYFTSRMINGVNFLAVDNGDYQFKKEQIPFLKNAVAQKLPIVLLIHNPLYTPELAQARLHEEPGSSLALAACPSDVEKGVPANEFTQEFLWILRESGLLRAVLAGHIHLHTNIDSVLWDNVHEYVVGGGYYGCGEHLIFE